MSDRIALLPLDERPVSTSLPVSIARIAGLDCVLPDPEELPRIRRPGDVTALGRWLADRRLDSAAAIVSLDGLGLGGLIPSRIGHETSMTVLDSWRVLSGPGAPVSAFALVPRTPDSFDAMEEPTYWGQHGPALHRLSTALASGSGVDEIRAKLPSEVRMDWIRRRRRQHLLALHAVELLADGTLARLVIGIDDASVMSLSAVEARSLSDWIAWSELSDLASVQPGADEIASVLVARASLDILGAPSPRIAIRCADPDALERIAPYEASRVRETIVRQVTAAGATPVFDASMDADAILVVHPPEHAGPTLVDWAIAPGDRPNPDRSRATALEFAKARRHSDIVGIADVARPNGADPTLIEALDAHSAWSRIDAFAAWNTAGNSIGTAVAQLVATFAGRHAGTFDPNAARESIARRFVEDYGWMSVERAAIRSELGLAADRHDTVPVSPIVVESLARSERRLDGMLTKRPGFAGISIELDSLSLPWGRAFEVDLSMTGKP